MPGGSLTLELPRRWNNLCHQTAKERVLSKAICSQGCRDWGRDKGRDRGRREEGRRGAGLMSSPVVTVFSPPHPPSLRTQLQSPTFFADLHLMGQLLKLSQFLQQENQERHR